MNAITPKIVTHHFEEFFQDVEVYFSRGFEPLWADGVLLIADRRAIFLRETSFHRYQPFCNGWHRVLAAILYGK